MRRKLWIILLLAALVLALCCGSAAAEKKGKLNSSISWELSDTGTLTLSGSGSTPDYGWPSNKSPFGGDESITWIFVEEGITGLGNELFHNCKNTTEVKLPESLKSIGSGAFFGNGIPKISIPFAVKSIGDSAFANCKELGSAKIHRGNALIGAGCFADCNAALVIGGWSNSTAETYASDSGIHFDAWPIIGYCGTNVYYAVDADKGEMTIFGDGSMNDYVSEESLPWELRQNDFKKIIIDNGVTRIGNRAFTSFQNLTAVVMADSVTEIGDHAFNDCIHLTSIPFSASLQKIGIYAFESCFNLTSVTLPASLKTIGAGAFACCDLTEVSVASGATQHRVFFYPTWGEGLKDYDREFLYYIDLPAGVTDAGFAVFAYTLLPHERTDFIVPAGVTAVNAETFAGVAARFVWLQDGVTSIGSKAFTGCSGLKCVRIPYTCQSIAAHAFPEGTVLIIAHAYALDYALQNGYDYIMLEDPYGGEG